MRLNFNSKDGVFTVKAESEEEKTAAQNVGDLPSAISSSIFLTVKSRK